MYEYPITYLEINLSVYAFLGGLFIISLSLFSWTREIAGNNSVPISTDNN